jgi:hypothetical protein
MGNRCGFQNNRLADGTSASQNIIGETVIVPGNAYL